MFVFYVNVLIVRHNRNMMEEALMAKFLKLVRRRNNTFVISFHPNVKNMNTKTYASTKKKTTKFLVFELFIEGDIIIWGCINLNIFAF